MQRWAISDLNPWLAWLAPAAEAVKAHRQAVPPESPSRQAEKFLSDLLSAGWEFHREIRDALSEAMFYETYGGLFGVYGGEAEAADKSNGIAQPRELPFVKEALESISEGDYPEAVARVFALLSQKGGPLPLARLHLKRELAEKYAHLVPNTSREQQRRIRGEQEIIVRYEPERAVQTLPNLIRSAGDRKRLDKLLDCVFTEEDLDQIKPSPEQIAAFKTIRGIILDKPRASARRSARLEQKKTRRRTHGANRYGIPHQHHV
jgi:hypothetical protein